MAHVMTPRGVEQGGTFFLYILSFTSFTRKLMIAMTCSFLFSAQGIRCVAAAFLPPFIYQFMIESVTLIKPALRRSAGSEFSHSKIVEYECPYDLV